MVAKIVTSQTEQVHQIDSGLTTQTHIMKRIVYSRVRNREIRTSCHQTGGQLQFNVL